MTSTSRLGDNIQTELRFDVTPTELIESQEPTNVPQTDMTDTSTEMTIVIAPQFFEGPIRSTSSYLLEGNFHYGYDENQLRLSLDETYKADTALPGLYVYLGNNPTTVSGAYEIGAVSIFQGAHSYTLPTSFGLMDYKYVLYWCKPFNVKVGEAILIEK